MTLRMGLIKPSVLGYFLGGFPFKKRFPVSPRKTGRPNHGEPHPCLALAGQSWPEAAPLAGSVPLPQAWPMSLTSMSRQASMGIWISGACSVVTSV